MVEPKATPGTVAAIIVSYNPDPEAFADLMERIAFQVDFVVVIDNASRQSEREAICRQTAVFDARLVVNEENLGLATAQRLGIQAALAAGADFILLLDQDSLPAPDMVERLRQAYEQLSAAGEPVAAVGPRKICGPSDQSIPFVRFRIHAALKRYCSGSGGLLRTDFLISSGLLAPAWVYERVGMPEDALFIDNIDLEWCFRAQHFGLRLFGVCDAVLFHQIGSQTRYVSMLNNIGPIHIHEPLRQYYQTRNRFQLYARHYAPWAWKIQDFPRALFKLLYFCLMISPRRENLRMMYLAVWDALRGVQGPFPYDR